MKGEHVTMKRSIIHNTSLRATLRLLVLTVVLAAVSSAHAAAAQPSTARASAGHGTRFHSAPPPAGDLVDGKVRRTVSTTLVKVEFQSGGLYVAAKFNANNLRDETVRMALFIGWGNGTWVETNPDAPSEYRSTGGYLTQQTTGVAPYTNTEWSYVEFYIPWEYFPPVTENADVFLQTFVGLDGQSFVANSWRQYFVLYASQ
jgi:hypothetical protein